VVAIDDPVVGVESLMAGMSFSSDSGSASLAMGEKVRDDEETFSKVGLEVCGFKDELLM